MFVRPFFSNFLSGLKIKPFCRLVQIFISCRSWDPKHSTRFQVFYFVTLFDKLLHFHTLFNKLFDFYKVFVNFMFELYKKKLTAEKRNIKFMYLSKLFLNLLNINYELELWQVHPWNQKTLCQIWNILLILFNCLKQEAWVILDVTNDFLIEQILLRFLSYS